MKKLIILSTQRSGSTMVCDDISGTDLLGTPSEYFIKVIENMNVANETELKKLVFEALEKGKTKNGVVGLKIMSNQILPIGKILHTAGLTNNSDNVKSFFEFFSDAIYLRVIRSDKVAQAVSRIIAEKTNIYHIAKDSSKLEGIGKLSMSRDESMLIDEYDANTIQNEIKKITMEEEFLDEILLKNHIKCMQVTYENIVKDRSYIHNIARKFNLTVTLKDRRLKKVSGEVSKQWIEKFCSEELRNEISKEC